MAAVGLTFLFAMVMQQGSTTLAVQIGESAIAQKRCQLFAKQRGQPATDFEFYVLWNSPAQVDHPGPAVRERAGRFVNLVNRQ